MIETHLARLERAVREFGGQTATVEAWGRHLAGVLLGGGRLLACGNGGSAAQAQHFTAELVGRYEAERAPFSAIALNTDMSTLTAIGNDYGANEIFARQVRAHGRPGDVLMALSTSGGSRNVIEAARAADRIGVTTWALTGPGPNLLEAACQEAVTINTGRTSTVQEMHLAVIHMICAVVDHCVQVDAAGEAEQRDLRVVRT